MAIKETLETVYLCWLSKPKAERALYRYVRRHRPRSIVEIGVESHQRSLRLIRQAKRFSPGQEIRYSGIDLFDARPADRPSMTLKSTHTLLSGSGASIRLIPGDAYAGLARSANQLLDTHLLLIGPDQDPISLQRAWMYIPRTLAGGAIVLQAIRAASGLEFKQISLDEVQNLANKVQRQQRAA